MQWNGEDGAGFTDGESWLPIPEKARSVNVAAQENESSSLLSLTRTLIQLRKEHRALSHGQLDFAGYRTGCIWDIHEISDRRVHIGIPEFHESDETDSPFGASTPDNPEARQLLNIADFEAADQPDPPGKSVSSTGCASRSVWRRDCSSTASTMSAARGHFNKTLKSG